MNSDYRLLVLLPERYEVAEKFYHNYLAEPGADLFAKSFESNPELAVECQNQVGELIGLCFGAARQADAGEVTLQGIVIHPQLASHGLGSLLLRRFEEIVAEQGYHKISVGSADGYVEHFYLKNGYVPSEYLVYLPDKNDSGLDGLDVRRVREEGGKLMVNIRIDGNYDAPTKKSMQQRLKATSISLILEKSLTSLNR